MVKLIGPQRVNPKFKALVPFSVEEKSELKSYARNLLDALIPRLPTPDLDHNYAPAAQKACCLIDEEFEEWQEPCVRESSDEVSLYGSMDLDDAITNLFCERDSEINLIKFWSSSHIKGFFPRLSRLALGILAIPTSSSASERAFSVCTNTVNRQRTLLSCSTVDGIFVSNSHIKGKIM